MKKVHNHKQHMYDMCKNHMHAYVLAEMEDGSKVDGIITGLDNEYVYMAVPISEYEHAYTDESTQSHQRQYGGYPGYGYPGYGTPYYGLPGYGYGYRPRRRFRRFVFPLAALAALSILPWY
ncbi:hypothetical protein ACLIBH_07695 [Virgibacillus sp. W0430]|uniref:hypothetical protein n=1 Tax=Virgibacillus sp. W0430 TaxID=3391580 RepID=UPI003F4531F8